MIAGTYTVSFPRSLFPRELWLPEQTDGYDVWDLSCERPKIVASSASREAAEAALRLLLLGTGP